MQELQAKVADGAEQLRSQIGADHPAGPLFTGGEFAEADIGNFPNITIKCGTACTGSATRWCC